MITVTRDAQMSACTLGRFQAFARYDPWNKIVDGKYYVHSFRPGPFAGRFFWNRAMIFPLITEDYRFLFGLDDAQWSSTSVAGLPLKSTRSFDGWNDTLRYGSLIGGALSLRRPVKNSAGWGHDSDLDHTSYRGAVTQRGYPSRVYWNTMYDQDNVPKLGINFPGTAVNRIRRGCKIPSSQTDSRRWQPVELSYENEFTRGTNMSYAVDWLQQPLVIREDNTLYSATNTWRYYDFILWDNVVRNETSIVIDTNFHFTLENDARSTARLLDSPPGAPVYPYDHSFYRVMYKFRTVLHPTRTKRLHSTSLGFNYLKFAFDEELTTEVDIQVMSRQTNVNADDPIWDPSLSYTIAQHKLLDPNPVIAVTHEPPNGDITTDPLSLFYNPEMRPNQDPSDTSRLASLFKGYTDKVLMEVTEFAALSANDCLKNFQSDFNALEFAREAPGTVKLAFGNDSFLAGFKELLHNGKSWDADSFVSTLAQNFLKYKYAAAPLPDDTTEVVSDFQRVVDGSLAILETFPKVLYGKWEFKIPDRFELFDTDVNLTIRTKMVLHQSPGQVLLWAMTADQVGLLPSLKRLWDLRRLSFVVDWFTGLGDRLQFWDHSSIRALLDVAFYEHTYLFETPIPSNICRKFSLVPHGAQVRRMVRYRSHYHPFLSGSSKYDPFKPGGPDLLAAGSLLWVSK